MGSKAADRRAAASVRFPLLTTPQPTVRFRPIPAQADVSNVNRNSPRSSSNRHQGVYRGGRPDKRLKWEPGLWSLHSATWDGVEVRPSPAGGNRLWPQDAR